MTPVAVPGLGGGDEERPAGISAGYAGYALGLLTSINLLNYLTRNAVFALFEPVKRDLGLTDANLGPPRPPPPRPWWRTTSAAAGARSR